MVLVVSNMALGRPVLYLLDQHTPVILLVRRPQSALLAGPNSVL
jgi:hypothetical protein